MKFGGFDDADEELNDFLVIGINAVELCFRKICGFKQDFKPILRLFRFFQGNSELCQKVGGALRPVCLSAIRAYTRTASQKLL